MILELFILLLVLAVVIFIITTVSYRTELGSTSIIVGAMVMALLFFVLLAIYVFDDSATPQVKQSVVTSDEGEDIMPLFHFGTESNPYTPQQVGSVYIRNGDNYSTTGSGVSYGGAGQKIGIITCYDHRYVQRDFDVFCKKYDLKQKTLIIHNRARRRRTNWAVETCLDTQWAHVFAPDAEIHVFQAYAARYSYLRESLQDAVDAGMNIISMSLGSGESSYALSQVEDIFRDHPEITFMAASGDWATVSYPSSSDNVISVGGTRLHVAIDGLLNSRKPEEADYTMDPSRFSKIGETDWSTPRGIGTGHGLSQLFQRPSYQDGHNASPYRATPDLSLMASSAAQRGVSIFYSSRRGDVDSRRIYENRRYWMGVEGTSLSCPMLAGMLATINSERNRLNKQPLNRTQLLQFLYASVPTNLPIETSHDGVGFVGRAFIPACVSA